jgi:hypothetical protein
MDGRRKSEDGRQKIFDLKVRQTSDSKLITHNS